MAWCSVKKQKKYKENFIFLHFTFIYIKLEASLLNKLKINHNYDRPWLLLSKYFCIHSSLISFRISSNVSLSSWRTVIKRNRFTEITYFRWKFQKKQPLHILHVSRTPLQFKIVFHTITRKSGYERIITEFTCSNVLKPWNSLTGFWDENRIRDFPIRSRTASHSTRDFRLPQFD
jgi:hypothetical protein